jgi:hypothetical protein
MSIKDLIVSEVKSVAQEIGQEVIDTAKDVATATRLDPSILVITSAVEAKRSSESFKDRVIHNMSEGVQALERLGEKFSRSSGPFIPRLWSEPRLPSVILRDGPISAEKRREVEAELSRSLAPPSEEGPISGKLLDAEATLMQLHVPTQAELKLEARMEYKMRMEQAKPSFKKYGVSEPDDGRTPLAEVMKRGGVTPEQFQKDVEALRIKLDRKGLNKKILEKVLPLFDEKEVIRRTEILQKQYPDLFKLQSEKNKTR